MGGCCSSSQKFRYHGTPVYYYCPPALEEHDSLTSPETAFPTRLQINIALDTSIPDTYRSPPRPIPFDVVFGIPQSTESSPDMKDCGDLSFRKSTHVKEVDRETESNISFVESQKKVAIGFQTSKGLDGSYIEEEDVCPTCFEEYDAENPKIVTKCNHRFHLSCILEWMERSDTCPICSQEMKFEDL